jgi:hypothetical protein
MSLAEQDKENENDLPVISERLEKIEYSLRKITENLN